MHVQKEQIIKRVRKSNEYDKYEQIIRQTGTKVQWVRQIRTNDKTDKYKYGKNDDYCCSVNIYSCITDKDDASMSYLRYLCYLCLFLYNNVQHILCCVLLGVLFRLRHLMLLILIVLFWLPLQHSLTFVCKMHPICLYISSQ